MDAATRQIGAIVLITVLTTLGVIYYYDGNVSEAPIVSTIDDVALQIDGIGDQYINTSLQFSVTIENYGRVKTIQLPCENTQSYLALKNSSTPLVHYNTSTADLVGYSYILNSTFTTTTCTGEPSTVRVSENIINEIIVVVPFQFLSGEYSFIWQHSYATEFDAVTIRVDTTQGAAGITTIVENPGQS